MSDHKNTILAIVLSGIVLFGWEYFFGMPQKQREEALRRQIQTTQVQPPPAAPQSVPAPAAGGATVPRAQRDRRRPVPRPQSRRKAARR